MKALPFLTITALFAVLPFVSRADTNIAPSGTVIMGYNTSGDISTYGTNYKGNGGPLTNINDGNTSAGNSVDEFGEPGGSLGSDAFVGILFSAPINLQVNSVDYYASFFGDGGWFGKSGVGASGTDQGFGEVLTAAALIEPTLQYTTNGGASWTNLSVTDNYVGLTEGTQTPSGGNVAAPEVTFTLNAPVTGIDGLRLIGQNGGYANGGGFIGVIQFEVNAGTVPEPSTYALMLGGLALLAFALHSRSLRA